jgi:catechol 2,3-dioxygenase-like lactoylglutathione lyase family enzyme
VSRVQLALNVANLEESVEFYTKLFATEPAKIRPGYANFAVADPPLKLVLIEDATKVPSSINHLGVEVENTDEVSSARARLEGDGVATEVEDQVACCYALQDKVWALGPGGSSTPCWATSTCQRATFALTATATICAALPPWTSRRSNPRPVACRRVSVAAPDG